MSTNSLIVSLGGSVIIPSEIDVEFLKQFRDLILNVSGKYEKIFIVAGGGSMCRVYQKAARELGNPSNDQLDQLGIMVSRVNAELLAVLFSGHCYPEVVYDPSKKITFKEKIMLGAGWQPGWSTDYVSVTFAKTYGAKEMLNLSNTRYIYNKDPAQFDDAVRMSDMAWKDLKVLFSREWEPGMNIPFDPKAVELAAKSRLKVVFLLGTDIGNLKNYFEGKQFKGTAVE